METILNAIDPQWRTYVLLQDDDVDHVSLSSEDVSHNISISTCNGNVKVFLTKTQLLDKITEDNKARQKALDEATASNHVGDGEISKKKKKKKKNKKGVGNPFHTTTSDIEPRGTKPENLPGTGILDTNVIAAPAEPSNLPSSSPSPSPSSSLSSKKAKSKKAKNKTKTNIEAELNMLLYSNMIDPSVINMISADIPSDKVITTTTTTITTTSTNANPRSTLDKKTGKPIITQPSNTLSSAIHGDSNADNTKAPTYSSIISHCILDLSKVFHAYFFMVSQVQYCPDEALSLLYSTFFHQGIAYRVSNRNPTHPIPDDITKRKPDDFPIELKVLTLLVEIERVIQVKKVHAMLKSSTGSGKTVLIPIILALLAYIETYSSPSHTSLSPSCNSRSSTAPEEGTTVPDIINSMSPPEKVKPLLPHNQPLKHPFILLVLPSSQIIDEKYSYFKSIYIDKSQHRAKEPHLLRNNNINHQDICLFKHNQVKWNRKFFNADTYSSPVLILTTPVMLVREFAQHSDIDINTMRIILDEAHQRTAWLDVLLSILCRHKDKSHHTSILVMSATPDNDVYTTLDRTKTANLLLDYRPLYSVDKHHTIVTQTSHIVQTVCDYAVDLMNNMMQPDHYKTPLHRLLHQRGHMLVFMQGLRECQSMLSDINKTLRQQHKLNKVQGIIYHILSTSVSDEQNGLEEDKPGAGQAQYYQELESEVNEVLANLDDYGYTTQSSISSQDTSTPPSIVFILPIVLTGQVLPLQKLVATSSFPRQFQTLRNHVYKLIVATNAVESSVTIDDLTALVDSGVHKESVYDIEKGVSVLTMRPISEDSRTQRVGRVGRVSCGQAAQVIYQPKGDTISSDHGLPDIISQDPGQIFLQLRSYNILLEKINHDLPSPLPDKTLTVLQQQLTSMGLITDEGLTQLGRDVAKITKIQPLYAAFIAKGLLTRQTRPIYQTWFQEVSAIGKNNTSTNPAQPQTHQQLQQIREMKHNELIDLIVFSEEEIRVGIWLFTIVTTTTLTDNFISDDGYTETIIRLLSDQFSELSTLTNAFIALTASGLTRNRNYLGFSEAMYKSAYGVLMTTCQESCNVQQIHPFFVTHLARSIVNYLTPQFTPSQIQSYSESITAPYRRMVPQKRMLFEKFTPYISNKQMMRAHITELLIQIGQYSPDWLSTRQYRLGKIQFRNSTPMGELVSISTHIYTDDDGTIHITNPDDVDPNEVDDGSPIAIDASTTTVGSSHQRQDTNNHSDNDDTITYSRLYPTKYRSNSTISYPNTAWVINRNINNSFTPPVIVLSLYHSSDLELLNTDREAMLLRRNIPVNSVQSTRTFAFHTSSIPSIEMFELLLDIYLGSTKMDIAQCPAAYRRKSFFPITLQSPTLSGIAKRSSNNQDAANKDQHHDEVDDNEDDEVNINRSNLLNTIIDDTVDDDAIITYMIISTKTDQELCDLFNTIYTLLPYFTNDVLLTLSTNTLLHVQSDTKSMKLRPKSIILLDQHQHAELDKILQQGDKSGGVLDSDITHHIPTLYPITKTSLDVFTDISRTYSATIHHNNPTNNNDHAQSLPIRPVLIYNLHKFMKEYDASQTGKATSGVNNTNNSRPQTKHTKRLLNDSEHDAIVPIAKSYQLDVESYLSTAYNPFAKVTPIRNGRGGRHNTNPYNVDDDQTRVWPINTNQRSLGKKYIELAFIVDKYHEPYMRVYHQRLPPSLPLQRVRSNGETAPALDTDVPHKIKKMLTTLVEISELDNYITTYHHIPCWSYIPQPLQCGIGERFVKDKASSYQQFSTNGGFTQWVYDTMITDEAQLRSPQQLGLLSTTTDDQGSRELPHTNDNTISPTGVEYSRPLWFFNPVNYHDQASKRYYYYSIDQVALEKRPPDFRFCNRFKNHMHLKGEELKLVYVTAMGPKINASMEDLIQSPPPSLPAHPQLVQSKKANSSDNEFDRPVITIDPEYNPNAILIKFKNPLKPKSKSYITEFKKTMESLSRKLTTIIVSLTFSKSSDEATLVLVDYHFALAVFTLFKAMFSKHVVTPSMSRLHVGDSLNNSDAHRMMLPLTLPDPASSLSWDHQSKHKLINLSSAYYNILYNIMHNLAPPVSISSTFIHVPTVRASQSRSRDESSEDQIRIPWNESHLVTVTPIYISLQEIIIYLYPQLVDNHGGITTISKRFAHLNNTPYLVNATTLANHDHNDDVVRDRRSNIDIISHNVDRSELPDDAINLYQLSLRKSDLPMVNDFTVDIPYVNSFHSLLQLYANNPSLLDNIHPIGYSVDKMDDGQHDGLSIVGSQSSDNIFKSIHFTRHMYELRQCLANILCVLHHDISLPYIISNLGMIMYVRHPFGHIKTLQQYYATHGITIEELFYNDLTKYNISLPLSMTIGTPLQAICQPIALSTVYDPGARVTPITRNNQVNNLDRITPPDSILGQQIHDDISEVVCDDHDRVLYTSVPNIISEVLHNIIFPTSPSSFVPSTRVSSYFIHMPVTRQFIDDKDELQQIKAMNAMVLRGYFEKLSKNNDRDVIDSDGDDDDDVEGHNDDDDSNEDDDELDMSISDQLITLFKTTRAKPRHLTPSQWRQASVDTTNPVTFPTRDYRLTTDRSFLQCFVGSIVSLNYDQDNDDHIIQLLSLSQYADEQLWYRGETYLDIDRRVAIRISTMEDSEYNRGNNPPLTHHGSKLKIAQLGYFTEEVKNRLLSAYSFIVNRTSCIKSLQLCDISGDIAPQFARLNFPRIVRRYYGDDGRVLFDNKGEPSQLHNQLHLQSLSTMISFHNLDDMSYHLIYPMELHECINDVITGLTQREEGDLVGDVYDRAFLCDTATISFNRWRTQFDYSDSSHDFQQIYTPAPSPSTNVTKNHHSTELFCCTDSCLYKQRFPHLPIWVHSTHHEHQFKLTNQHNIPYISVPNSRLCVECFFCTFISNKEVDFIYNTPDRPSQNGLKSEHDNDGNNQSILTIKTVKCNPLSLELGAFEPFEALMLNGNSLGDNFTHYRLHFPIGAVIQYFMHGFHRFLTPASRVARNHNKFNSHNNAESFRKQLQRQSNHQDVQILMDIDERNVTMPFHVFGLTMIQWLHTWACRIYYDYVHRVTPFCPDHHIPLFNSSCRAINRKTGGECGMRKCSLCKQVHAELCSVQELSEQLSIAMSPTTPCCKQPFVFDGCAAVSCDGCKIGFCAFCLEAAGPDAHPHVRSCSLNPNRGSYFATTEQIRAANIPLFKPKVLDVFRSIQDQPSRLQLFSRFEKDMEEFNLTVDDIVRV